MKLQGKKIGVAITGSFCTFQTLYEELEKLMAQGAEVFPILSFSCQSIESRFGTPEEYEKRIETITGKKVMKTIGDAEPIGPKAYLDALVIFPCTGNTIAKLANGITDTPSLMGAKAHLRNQLPLVIAVSTNDGLGMNMKNIGLLLNSKNIYFVPFGQDDPVKKPNSLVAHMELLGATLESALEGKQYHPVIY